MQDQIATFTVFQNCRYIGSGCAGSSYEISRRALDRGGARVLIFDDRTGHTVEPQILLSLDPAQRGPGRPKLGVVAREVTLLPRHWDWLSAQPGGASVTLRKLVDEARKASAETDKIRNAREAAYRFLAAIAADLTHYEEALRALFAGDREGFESNTAKWPKKLRSYALNLAADGI